MDGISLIVSVKCQSSKNKTETLNCSRLLRSVPGKRKVYEGFWNNRAVIIKIFSDKISAKRHLKREWRGLTLLTELELNSPEPLFYGRDKNGSWVVVTAMITDSLIAVELFDKFKLPDEKLDLLILVCRTLAEQHKKGVLQKDLHLGNFLMRNGAVYLLDPAQMKFFRRPVKRGKSISQLARLACCLGDDETEFAGRVLQEYVNLRGWQSAEKDKILLRKKFKFYKAKTIKRALKKSLRTSKRYIRIKSARYSAVFDRQLCRQAEPVNLIGQVDLLMDKGRILKKGNTCYVSRVSWNGQDVVIKRYNHKGLIHSVRHSLKGSRAKRSWLNAHRLLHLGIETPLPLAFLEVCKFGLLWQSHIVTSYCDVVKLYDFLRDDSLTNDKRQAVKNKFAELLKKLEAHSIVHGDMKQSNILVNDSKLVLTDLDSMKKFRCRWLFRLRYTKDRKCFKSV